MRPIDRTRRESRHSLPALALASLYLAGLVSTNAVATEAPTRTIELSDLEGLVGVSGPRISPDGRRVVVTIRRPDYEENRYVGQLLLVDLESGESRPLTHDRPSVRSARWSPDGSSITFLATDRSGDGETRPEETTQVFRLPLRGGEAHALTEAPQGVLAYEWHPSGDRLITVAADEKPEPPEGPERHNRSFVVGHHDYLADAAPEALHLWSDPIAPGDAERLTPPGSAVVGGLLAFFAVSPDGHTVTYTGAPADWQGDQHAIRLEVLDLETGSLRDFGDGLDLVSSGRVSPDGGHLAYSLAGSGRPYYSAHTIYVAPASGGQGRAASAGIDRTFYGALWTPAGELLLGAADGTRTRLWRQPLDGAATPIDLGDLNPASGYAGPDLDIGPNGEIVVVASTSTRPPELYLVANGGSPRRLTELNAATEGLELGRVETLRWETHDGFTADGTVTLPPGYDPEREYPLVLKIHGGPMSSSKLSFDALGQLIAARGWIVFEPNYRGSDNLGNAYQSAIIGDAGVGPGKDVMAGIAALRSEYRIDPGRVAVSGWSYGGYMTSWLIGNYPETWAAAVAGAPVTDYTDQYALSDVNTLFGWGFPELPWSESGQTLWRTQSPIAHAHRAKAPTLILCDTGDLRVPITESYKLYHALDDAGTPVEFVAYPVPGHFPGDPVHQRDVYRRWADWIERWFDAVGEAADPV